MALAINPNPYVRDRRSTPKIMIQLLIGLIIVWLAGIIYYFKNGTVGDGLLAIFNVVICVVTSIVTEGLFLLPKWKKEADHSFTTLAKKVFNSYGYISGIILALVLPLTLNARPFIHIICLIITTVMSVGVFKMLFGGFGHNIFNVALVGRIFASLCFGANFGYGHEILESKEVVSTGATILTKWSGQGWNSIIGFLDSNITVKDLFLGNYRGALGETFTLIILIIGVIFVIRKVIDWKLPVFYLGACLLTTLLVGAFNFRNLQIGSHHVGYFTFVAQQMFTGGIVFGAIFCITDPVTAPTNSLAKIIYATFAGFLTMLIRFVGAAPEGVAYSILAANMLAPFIANFFKGRTTTKLVKRSCITAGICAFMVLVSCAYQNVVKPFTFAGGADVTLIEKNKETRTYNVRIENSESSYKYAATANLNLNVVVNPAARTVLSVEVLEEGTTISEEYGWYFFGVGHPYEYINKQKVDALRNELYTFGENGISFDTFRKYDFNYFDQTDYKQFNDLSKEISGSRVTYTISSYVYCINAVIDAVEGR